MRAKKILFTAVYLISTTLTVFAQERTLEIINMDSVLINNKVPFKTTVKNLKEKFGRPDSIVTRTHECGGYFEGTVSVYYYGQTVFESYKDTVVLRKIDFNDGRFKLKTTQLLLDSETTFNDIKYFFPTATDESFDRTDSANKKAYQLVRIQPRANYEDQWILKFYKGKLIEMEYWIPC